MVTRASNLYLPLFLCACATAGVIEYGGGLGGYGLQQPGLAYGGYVQQQLPFYGGISQQLVPYAASGGGVIPYGPVPKPVIEPHHILPHGYGGEEVDKTVFGGGKKALTGEHYEKINGNKGEQFHHGDGGFHEGKTFLKDAKGDNAYYADIAEQKKLGEDAKKYYGGQHFDKEGKQGEEKKISHGHKKGKVVKGFKNSHHKDETGHTEEYYDENHDEGGEAVFGGNFGSFGQSGASNFKGGHEDGELYANEHKKSGHYDNEHLVDKAGADHGKYGGNRFLGNGVAYGKNNGIDEHTLQGHHESERVLKHHPFYGGYF